MIWTRRTRIVLLVCLVFSGIVGPARTATAHIESGASRATGDATSSVARPTVRADFNHDGAEDLAIGAQFESVGSVPDAGTVFVLFGRSGGLSGSGSQLFNQESPGIVSVAEPGDGFGSALAAGDFDGDGFTDLAIGSRGESVGNVASAGVVHVLHGSAGGLASVGSRLFTQDSPGVGSTAEEFDGFGAALAAADFNGDGADDLAVGADFERVGTVDGAGAVNVLYGATTTGLSGNGSSLFVQGAGISGQPGPFDQFGSALAGADFNDDGFDDLAIGVPRESGNLVTEAGTVQILHGSAANLTTVGDQIFTQGTVRSEIEPFDNFGATLAAGNFNGDDFVDLAVGSPGETVRTVDGAGTIFTLVGTSTGVHRAGSQLFNQESPGIASTAEFFDAFGDALAAGDFDGDGSDDLAIGVPNESVGAIELAGAANVLYGSNPGGLSSSGSQLIAQGAAGVGSTAEAGDRFATALAAGDFNADGSADLALGAPFEAVGPVSAAGAVNVLSGSAPTGLVGTGSKLFTQDSPGIGSTAETFDTFGFSLAATTPTPD
jgi:hypothetical protein